MLQMLTDGMDSDTDIHATVQITLLLVVITFKRSLNNISVSLIGVPKRLITTAMGSHLESCASKLNTKRKRNAASSESLIAAAFG